MEKGFFSATIGQKSPYRKLLAAIPRYSPTFKKKIEGYYSYSLETRVIQNIHQQHPVSWCFTHSYASGWKSKLLTPVFGLRLSDPEELERD